MQASNYILTNEYDTITMQVPNVATVKIEVCDNNVHVISNLDNDVCIVVGLSNTVIHHLYLIWLGLSFYSWFLWMSIKPITICRT